MCTRGFTVATLNATKRPSSLICLFLFAGCVEIHKTKPLWRLTLTVRTYASLNMYVSSSIFCGKVEPAVESRSRSLHPDAEPPHSVTMDDASLAEELRPLLKPARSRLCAEAVAHPCGTSDGTRYCTVITRGMRACSRRATWCTPPSRRARHACACSAERRTALTTDSCARCSCANSPSAPSAQPSHPQ